MQDSIELHSKRITYIPFHQVDQTELLDDMTELLGKSDNTTYFWNGKTWNSERVNVFYNKQMAHWEQYKLYGAYAAYESIAEDTTRKFMGFLDLHQTGVNEYKGHTNAVEIGYIIDTSFKGCKYGVEIAHFGYQYMENLSLSSAREIAELPTEMVATVDPMNIPSVKILEKVLSYREEQPFCKEEYDGRQRYLFFKPFATTKAPSAEPTVSYSI